MLLEIELQALICRRLGTEDGLILEEPLFEFFLKDDDLGDPLIKRSIYYPLGGLLQKIL